MIIGADEVGYGCLAGPLVVCAVMAPNRWSLRGLNDSKKLSEKKRLRMREKLSKLIEDKLIFFHIAERSSFQIDKLGIAVALKSCYDECIRTLDKNKDCQVIIDGILKFDSLVQDGYKIKSVPKADTRIPTVMAASILAKTYRDDLMKAYHLLHPMYNWISNMGYGSAEHLKAIEEFGPSPLHRFSYAPMKNM